MLLQHNASKNVGNDAMPPVRIVTHDAARVPMVPTFARNTYSYLIALLNNETIV